MNCNCSDEGNITLHDLSVLNRETETIFRDTDVGFGVEIDATKQEEQLSRRTRHSAEDRCRIPNGAFHPADVGRFALTVTARPCDGTCSSRSTQRDGRARPSPTDMVHVIGGINSKYCTWPKKDCF